MYELKIITSFSAAHSLKNFKGKCEALHGHNWKVEVWVRGSELDENGLLIDFKEVKDATYQVLEELDHKHLNDLEPFKTENPSSERIARYIFDEISKKLNRSLVRVDKVAAWESDDACAYYYEQTPHY